MIASDEMLERLRAIWSPLPGDRGDPRALTFSAAEKGESWQVEVGRARLAHEIVILRGPLRHGLPGTQATLGDPPPVPFVLAAARMNPFLPLTARPIERERERISLSLSPYTRTRDLLQAIFLSASTLTTYIIRRELRNKISNARATRGRFPSTPRHHTNGVYIPLFYFCKIGRSK